MSGDLRALAEAATPGPWGWDAWKRQPTAEPTACVTAGAHDLAVLNGCPVEPGDDDEGWLTRWMQDREAAANADAAFIAAANPATILALLDERDALAAKVERVSALAERAKREEATSLSRTFDGGTFGAWIDADRILAALGDQP